MTDTIPNSSGRISLSAGIITLCSIPPRRYAQVADLIFGGRTRGFDRVFLRTAKQPDGCVYWLGSVDQDGYAQVSAYSGHWRLSRLVYEFCIGPIPPGLHVLHRCDCPPCVNPPHLYLGTNRDNIDDMLAKGRSVRGSDHYNAKLTADDVHVIRRRVAAGESGLSVGRDFGISGMQALRIHKRTTWNHLPDQPQPTEALS